MSNRVRRHVTRDGTFPLQSIRTRASRARLAIEAEMLGAKPPLPTVKIRNTRKGFFEADEIAKVLKHLPADIPPAIEFAYFTGWRIGEIRKLTWTDHLDLDGGVIRLAPGETKNEQGGPSRLRPIRPSKTS